MRYNKFFANFKSFVIFSAVCFFVQFSFADDSSMCSVCKVRELNDETGVSEVKREETVCSCQSYCEISDNTDPNKIVSRVQNGCKRAYSQETLANPEFEPKWTNAFDTFYFHGGEYREFKLEAGMTYRWTTYDELEDFAGNVDYYKQCQTHSECGDKMRCYGKLSSGFGYCMWPFDTELTLIDTDAISDHCENGKVLAFSRSGGYENQSAIEYKAPRDMKVTLLITNNKYNESTKSFVSCQDSEVDGEDLGTMVKWQRYIEDYCKTCGDEDDYDFNKINNSANRANPNKAPNWSEIQDYSYIDLPNFASAQPAEKWLKPGSYVDFNVEEGKIYRWATCKSVFFDTQLTLFKPDGDEGCGKFLAFDDDSETSYMPKNPWDQSGTNDYCPAGTKQSVLEWHANFTGTVRLLFNEYNCSQCARDNNSVMHWSQCFRVTEDYKLVKDDEGHVITDSFGNPVVEKDGKGFPVVADSSTSSTERETLTYLYSFPLDWQRYDCNSCRGTAVEYVADYCGYAKYNGSCVEDVCDSFGDYTPFCITTGEEISCGDEVSLQSGQYMTFALRRGSKYIFQTPDRDEVVITVKAGASCENGVTLAQGRGQVAYFAETSAECFDSQDDDTFYPQNYSDVVTVLVSEPECDNSDGNISPINLKYSFYTDSIVKGKIDKVENAADANNRFSKNTISGKSYYEDSATGIRFIEAEKFAGTWEEAIDICQNLELGGDSGAFECAPAACPKVPTCNYDGVNKPCYELTDPGTDSAICTVSNDTCMPPKCNQNYEPYVDSRENGRDICDDEHLSSGLCGLCISSYNTLASAGGNCNKGTQKVNGRWTGGTCSTSNTCVVKDNNSFCRNIVGVTWGCKSEGYVPVSDSDDYCYNPEEENAEDLYYEPSMTDAHIDSGMHLAETQGNNGISCPDGTTYNNGCCEPTTCGTYTLKDNVSCNANSGDGSIIDENKCYVKIYASFTGGGVEGGEIPCCIGTIDVWDKTTAFGKTTYTDNGICGKLGKVPNNTNCADTIPCADGWTNLNNQCHKCKTGADGCGWDAYDIVCCDGSNCTPYAANTGNVYCRPKCDVYYSEPLNNSDIILQHCVTCEDGSTPVEIDGEWKCSITCDQGGSLQTSGEHKNKCKKTCSGKHISGDKCYTKEVKEYRCDEGWVEKDGFCKKIDSAKSYPDCSYDGTSTMESTRGRTCRNDYPDNYFPNTVECWCKTEKCGIDAQPKQCDSYVSGNQQATACRIGNKGYLNQPDLGNSNPCEGKAVYPVTRTEAEGSIYCEFTDLTTNETCGKPSKGWTLPDINQLYSLVDFDLYDPATAFPFKIGTYKWNKVCSSNSDCNGNGLSGYTCNTVTRQCTKTCSTDTDCSEDGRTHFCYYGECVRNNWFWSNTNVIDKDNPQGQAKKATFVWAVNMEDGRSYRVLKGCYVGEGDDPHKCDSYSLNATAYQVMCIKGSTLAALFHSGRPQNEQIFSGWACDKEKPDNLLDIYFEITDSEGRNLRSLVPSEAFIMIPGTNIYGVHYGQTDLAAAVGSDDDYKMQTNCPGYTGQAHVFTFDLNNPGTRTALATAIKSIDPGDGTTPYGKPPYYVTAYAVDTTINAATIVQPSKERFVIHNKCGDKYKTYDGTPEGNPKPEDCEFDDFETDCKYTDPWSEDPAHQCKICSQTTCMWTGVKVPGCGDGIIQSKDCVKENTTEKCGNTEGESCEVPEDHGPVVSVISGCEYYDFDNNNIGGFTEHCDCGNGSSIGMYLLNKNNDGTYSCDRPLEEYRCPDDLYYDKEHDQAADRYCVVCRSCSIVDNVYEKSRCGDGSKNGSEECDDGNLAENDYCLNNCKNAYCGDGKVLNSSSVPEADREVCDNGNRNGQYSYDEDGNLKPGCSADCKTVYSCGNSVIERANCGDYASCVTVPGAAEECDEGDNNGQPITYQRFIDSLDAEWKEKCAVTLQGNTYPISELQTEFVNCLNKYKAFVRDHACSSDCKKVDTTVTTGVNRNFCGDGYIDTANGEICDDGYDMTQSKYNGKGGILGCSLDCQFKYGCGTPAGDPAHVNGTDSNGIIDRSTCFSDMNDCDENTPKTTIGVEYYGSIINGNKEHISAKKIVLFVNMPGADEECDAGGSNGKYGICNSTCTDKPYCGDGQQSSGDEECDSGNVDGGNKDIENAWSQEYKGSCLGVFKDANNNNVCLDSKDKWFFNGEAVPCCTYGRYCGDGIIDNAKDGVGSTNDEGIVTDLKEWRRSADKWDVQGDSSIFVSISDLDLAVKFTVTSDDYEYQDVELDIDIPIVKGYRYFVEYDVQVQKYQSVESARMKAGAKMYDSSDNAIPTCEGNCLDTNPLFFVDGGGSDDDEGLPDGVWTNKKNSVPIVTADGASSSNHNWKEGTDHIKLYFQFKGPNFTSFMIRGLKIYTLESGKGSITGTGADEMCDNGEYNLDFEDAKNDNSYMSACTKYVAGKQTGCRWTNYCGDARKHTQEICDNGTNKSNVYNGCEPGCTEIGPRCGDGRLDIKAESDCPFRVPDEDRCGDNLDGCQYTVINKELCNLVSERYDANTYDDEGNFTGGNNKSFLVSEGCDQGGSNSNMFVGNNVTPNDTPNVIINETDLDLDNYGEKCRTNCAPSRCGDGIIDYVVRGANGNAITKEVQNSNGETVTVYDYVEECDCGLVAADTVSEAEALLLPIPSGYENDPAYALNQKTSEGIYICQADGKYYPNSNFSTKSGVSCRKNCTISRCGDGIKDFGEQCDDGNSDDHDDCTNNCKHKSSCGDGIFSFKRSYLCEELLNLPLSSTDKGIPTMTTMRDRGVVECCDAGQTACLNQGKPLCSTLVTDLTKDDAHPYGNKTIDGKFALHYWFERKIMHCCFNKKYETGNSEDDDNNCINDDHVFGNNKTLKDFVYYSCSIHQSATIIDPWEECGNVSYSERCEFCDLTNPNPTCGCKAGETECLKKCKEDPCGCIAYCEYRNSLKNDPIDLSDCTDTACIKGLLSGCVAECEERNTYCERATDSHPCWDRNGKCGDGVISAPNEACDNYVSGASQYSNLDGSPVDTTVQSGIGGKYCTGACIGSCTSESPLCGENVSKNCWQPGCTVADHDSGALSRCGDGKKDTFAGEACDEGFGAGQDLNGYYGHCNKECSGIVAECGNGIEESDTDQRGNQYKEYCDKAGLNGQYALNKADFCSRDCKDVEHNNNQGLYCGDGTIQHENNPDCTCTGENCKNADGLSCKSGVSGAAETCDPNDARTLSLKNAGLSFSEICPEATAGTSACKQPDTCGDGDRNPRFEGCDCGNTEGSVSGSGTCTKSYGSVETYGLGEGESGVKYNCATGCKADPIGNTITISPVEISGWACDPNNPMNLPANGFVELQFKGKTTTGNTVKITTDYTDDTLDQNIVKACGGVGANSNNVSFQHRWFYNPSVSGTGVDITDLPITVKVYAVKGSTRVQIGEGTFTLGKQCGDNIVTKCVDIPIKLPPNGTSGQIKNDWICLDESDQQGNAQSCGSNTKCVVVKDKCTAYGLENNKKCVDEMCDEGAANGPTGRCSSGKTATHPVEACDYNYCGDGNVQKPNGKAKASDVKGYNESDYHDYFEEECESGGYLCKSLFNTSCAAENPPSNCYPIGTEVVDSNSVCKTGTCKWTRTDCKIQGACQSLEAKATALGLGWGDDADAIAYTHSTYERSWTGSAWEHEAPTTLIHNSVTSYPENPIQLQCKFKCKDDTVGGNGAKFKWNDSTKKCAGVNGTYSCPTTCGDSNGGRYDGSTWKSCTEDGWKKMNQTASVSNGKVTYNPNNLTPFHTTASTPAANDCSYICKSGTTYVNGKCLDNSKPSVSCGTAPTNAVWAIVSGSTGDNYTVTTAASRTIKQTLGVDGNYYPETTPVLVKKTNITSGETYEKENTADTIYKNKCFYVCAAGSAWNGSACAAKNPNDGGCGDGKVNTNQCSRDAVYPTKSSVKLNGKTQDCYYEPNPANQESCDDGDNNGKYITTPITLDDGTKVSACNTTCTGRIKNGSSENKFFCGDGIVQKKSGDTSGCGTNGANCEQVITSSYTGWKGGDFTSEQCDPADTTNEDDNKTRVNKLCNLLMGTNRSDYYEMYSVRDITCSDSCTLSYTVYTGDTTNTSICGYQGDGVIQRYTCETNYYDGIACYNSLASHDDDEECDKEGSYTDSQLCQIKYGKYTYYSPSGLSCNDSGKVSGATKGSSSSTCRYCGDGVVSDGEECEGSEQQYCNNGCSGCGCSDEYKYRTCSGCKWGGWSSGASTSYTYGTYYGDC